MAAELIDILVRANIALAVAVVLILLLRAPVRRGFGAETAYGLWIGVPVALTAVLAPGPVRQVEDLRGALQAGSVGSEGGLVDLAAFAKNAGAPFGQSAPMPDLAIAALVLWGVGVATTLIVLAVRQHRFVRGLGRLRVDRRRGALVADADFAGPLVLGALRPRVVLPADFDRRYTPAEQAVVLAHEGVHLRRGDAYLNALAAALQAINWFNPLVHLAARQFRLDQELACDAAVLARHPRARAPYARAMLKTLLPGPVAPLGCAWPPSAAKVLKERLEMLKQDRPGRTRSLAGAAAVLVFALAAGGAAWAERPARVVVAPSSDADEPRTPASALGAALIEAAQAGREDEARRLVRAGADVNYRSLGDGTPLIAAARAGRREMVNLLLGMGAEVDLASPGDGNALIMAAQAGRLEVVRTLVQHGADVNGYVPTDETPLINAAGSGSLPVVEFLVEAGADVNLAFTVRTWDGKRERRSPLSQALRGGHGEVAAYLRQRGARS